MHIGEDGRIVDGPTKTDAPPPAKTDAPPPAKKE
jgi:hypothetical protein